MTTHPTPDLTDPERALIQWLSDTIGLSKNHEAELARRLAAMRQQPAPAPSEAEIEAWDQRITLAYKRRIRGEEQLDVPFVQAVVAGQDLMRRAAAQAPSSGNDKLRRLRSWLASGEGTAIGSVAQEIDRLLAEPEPAPAPDGELLARPSGEAKP
jgi:hypothetical protein